LFQESVFNSKGFCHLDKKGVNSCNSLVQISEP
jgi:hypothetical protein